MRSAAASAGSCASASRALATPARQRVLADQDRTLRAAAAFEADPAVQGLKERFGAEVIGKVRA